MPPWVYDVLGIVGAPALVLLNGFFVAAELALVTARKGQVARLEASLSTCQLGVAMASLALGWVGEPGFRAFVVAEGNEGASAPAGGGGAAG